MKRTRQYHRKQDDRIVAKRFTFIKNFGMFTKDEIEDLTLGRYRKRHPLSCGRPNCGLCQYYKLNDIKRIREVRIDQDMKEQLKELNNE